MADAVLSFVLDQLAVSLREESSLLGGLGDEIQHIKDELGQMKGFLGRSEEMVENNSDLKQWISQVRDVAYDTEDILDEFTLRFGRHYGHGFLGRVRKLVGSLKNLKARHQIATRIRAIKGRITNIAEAHQRYQNQFGNSEQASISSAAPHKAWYDSRGDALLLEEADLVGIERPKKKMMEMLFASDSQLRVISVVGMGGLGKTTLVKKVYDDPRIKNQFKLQIWITVSQSFEPETLLKKVIQQVNKSVADELLRTMDIHGLKQYVHDLLCQQTYIIVFDDIWRTVDWDALRMAFPRNNCSSRIMITTRNTEVGQAAMSDVGGDLYQLEFLSKDESWNLFCKKVFRATSCPQYLKDISESILKRCDGLPLAIVVIGGILATKSLRTEEWEVFNRSIGRQLRSNDRLENMTKLISLSYYALPEYLRICFLYLGIFPEDYPIEGDMLIGLWIGEGFVQKIEGLSIEEVAETYLHELINRSLVQVSKRRVDGRVVECRVHDIIQQIINEKVREQNMICVCSQQVMQSRDKDKDKARRLVILYSSRNTQVSNELHKCVRSLVFLWSFNFSLTTSYPGSLSEAFPRKLLCSGVRLIKVLELRGAPLEKIPNEVYTLFHLNYLSLRRTFVKSVSKLIGNLVKLETLDLKFTFITRLPNEILKLEQLRHLLLGQFLLFGHGFGGVGGPPKIGKLQFLQRFKYIDASEIEIVKEIINLTQLRSLGVTNLRKEGGKQLCFSLQNLTNLRYLSVASSTGEGEEEEEVLDLDHSLSSTPSQFLRTLKLRGRLKKTPRWISCLRGLTTIEFSDSQLNDEPLQLLQDLPNLMELRMYEASYEGEGLHFQAGGFQRLKVLKFDSVEKLRWMIVEMGAMPALELLSFFYCNSLQDVPTGIQYLTKLQEFQLSYMPDEFVKMVEHKYKDGEDSQKLAHIPFVLLETGVNGLPEIRNLTS